MKRTGLLVCLLIAVVSGATGALEWYRSSAGGIQGSPIRISGPESEGWSLSVEYSEEREIRTLYLDGTRQSSTIFHRAGGRLTTREELNAEGAVISRVEYAYDAEGNPRAIYIARGEESPGSIHVETDTVVNADGILRRHISGSGDDWRITDMNMSGQPLHRTILAAGVVMEESSWSRNDDGTLREEIYRSGDEVRRSRFDSNGRLLEETTTRNGSIVLFRSYHWIGTNLTRVEERGEGRIVVREIQWSGDRIVSESRTVDGVIVSKIVWESSENRVETLYRDGLAIIRVYWRDDVRRREEFLRDGEVVRVREAGS